jgi:hypothetical protein
MMRGAMMRQCDAASGVSGVGVVAAEHNEATRLTSVLKASAIKSSCSLTCSSNDCGMPIGASGKSEAALATS